MLSQVSCDTIGNLDDGTARAAINAAIGAAAADCEDRGEDKKVRKVVITLEFVKVSGRDVAITCEVGTTTPKYRTNDSIARLTVGTGKPQLFFNDMASEDPDQNTIDMEIDRNTRKPKREEN